MIFFASNKKIFLAGAKKNDFFPPAKRNLSGRGRKKTFFFFEIQTDFRIFTFGVSGCRVRAPNATLDDLGHGTFTSASRLDLSSFARLKKDTF